MYYRCAAHAGIARERQVLLLCIVPSDLLVLGVIVLKVAGYWLH